MKLILFIQWVTLSFVNTKVLHRTLIPASNTSFKPNVELGLVLNFVVSAFGFTPKLIPKGLPI